MDLTPRCSWWTMRPIRSRRRWSEGNRGGLLFPWNKAHAGNGFGLFSALNEVLGYIEKKQSGE